MMQTKEELERLTKDQLFAMAKDAGLAGFEAMTKKDIIDAIMSAPAKPGIADTKAKADEPVPPLKNGAGTGMKQTVVLQYNGAFKGTLTKYGKTWSNLARRMVPREEADMLINEFPGRFTIVR